MKIDFYSIFVSKQKLLNFGTTNQFDSKSFYLMLFFHYNKLKYVSIKSFCVNLIKQTHIVQGPQVIIQSQIIC